jgi:2'-5' RNA ligase
MQAVISLLPEPFNTQVEQIWDELEARFGLRYIRVTPIPHFTWQLGDGYQEDDVISLLHEISLNQQPFEVCTRGLNHFDGGTPVLFIEIRKSSRLLKLHSAIWSHLLPLTVAPSPLYSIKNWHPHITLAMEDFGWEMLDVVTAYLQPQNLSWRFVLDNLTIACQHADGKAQVEHVFHFGKGLTESFDCGLPAS